jgi:hypothetical protein
MLATVTAHQSRWGWHPCDHATHLALKAYHEVLFRDRRATARHGRWSAKDPHNRVRRHRDGTTTPVPEPRCLGTDQATYAWVLLEYRQSRRPQAHSEDVRPLDLPEGWRERAAQLAEFWGTPC